MTSGSPGPGADVAVEDRAVPTAAGRVAVRRWTPAPALARAGAAPLLLFHDSLGCVAIWRDFPEALARRTGRAVVAWDRPGFGASEPAPNVAAPGPLEPHFVGDEARVTVPALRAALGIGRFVALGHSVGGVMAACVAAREPADCAALVTLSAQAFNEDATKRGIEAAREGFRDAAQRARLARFHGERTDWVLAAWIETWLGPAFADWRLEASVRGVGAHPDAPHPIAAPVLAMQGALDEYGSPAHAPLIAGLGAGVARTVLIEGCGHVPYREQPQRVLDEVAAFLDEVDPVA